MPHRTFPSSPILATRASLLVTAAALLGFALFTSTASAQRGRACTADDGRQGTCQRVGACRAPNQRVPGFCPGSRFIQCCIPPEAEEPEETSTEEEAEASEPEETATDAADAPEEEPADEVTEERPVPAPEETAAGTDGAGSPLERAERANRDIDFVTAAEAAMEAIESGNLSPSELVRAYELHGVASAALGDDDAALASFTKMLALDPDREVRELSPALRAPYLQARGQIATMPETFEVEVEISRPTSSVMVQLTDALELASTIVMRSRGGGEGEFIEERFEAASTIRQEVEGIPETGWAESAVEILDEHGNRLRVMGTTDAPLTLGEPIIVVTEGQAWKSPWLWTALGLVVLGGAGVGLYYGLRPQPYDGQLGICFGCGQ